MKARRRGFRFFSQIGGFGVILVLLSLPVGMSMAQALPQSQALAVQTMSHGSKFVPGVDSLLAANAEEGEAGGEYQDMGAGENSSEEYEAVPGEEQQYQEGEPEYGADEPGYEGEYVEGGEEYPAEEEQGVIVEEPQEEYQEQNGGAVDYQDGDNPDGHTEQEAHEGVLEEPSQDGGIVGETEPQVEVSGGQ
jgi:hypothetical protein